MTQKAITLIPFRDGLAGIMRSRSSYYASLDPKSTSYDPDLPRTIPVGNAANSPRAFLAHEIDEYLSKLVARARGSREHGASKESACRTRREASLGE